MKHELAPDIVRQRLLLEGYFTTEVEREVLQRFLLELPAVLGLRTYGTPTIFTPEGLGRESNEGFDAFVPLIDSGISVYIWSQARFLALVVFTCKAFDADAAVAFTEDFFAMTETARQEF